MGDAPAFPLSRETRIRIDRDGRFFHEDDPITHPALAQALASWVDVDPDSGRYILKNPVNWCFVSVEDAPLVVRSLAVLDDGFELSLSDGVRERLDLSSLRLAPGDVPYCRVRGGRIPARFGRAAQFALLEHAFADPDGRLWLRAGRGARAISVPILAGEVTGGFTGVGPARGPVSPGPGAGTAP